MRAIICIILLFTSSVYPQWVKQNPLNAERNLNTLDFINTNTGWVAGDSGTIIKTVDAGDNWIYQNLPSRLSISSIKFINENTGFVCGDSGKILITTTGGSNWQYQSTGRNEKLFKITFVNQNTGFCVGQGCILKTTNTGLNWNLNYLNESSYFLSLFFINEQTGWVGGGNQPNHNLYKTTNCGQNWDTLLFTGQNDLPWQIFFLNESTGWVVYPYPSSYVSQTTNGGISWSSYGAGYNIQGLSFLNSQTGWGIGYRILKSTNGGVNWTILSYYAFGYSILFKGDNTGYIAGTTGMMIKTTNSGLNWTLNPPETHSSLFHVKFLNSNIGFAIGENGTIIKTTNGGNNWKRKNSGILSDLFKITLVGNYLCFAVGSNGTLMKSTNSGENWQSRNMGFSFSLNDVAFINENTGWVCGDSETILKTLDGGNNWISQHSGEGKLLFNILPLNQNTIFASGTNSLFLRSTNGGLNWIQLINDTLSNWYTCIYFLNDFTGWVTKAGISYERILKTTDVGDTWVNIPTEINYPLKKIIFFNENTGYGLNGQQCKTTNGGTNWIYQEIAPVPGGFNDIDFIDINTGWAVSYEGSIYKTTNGGLIPVSNISTEVPKSFILYQNYPNPFNPTTKIKFDIPTPLNPPFAKGGTAKPGGFVKLTIYDILGRKVEVLLNEVLQPGTYSVTWDASNFPSGVYFYKLETDGFSESKKMVLIK